jgi:xylulokinase
MMKEVVLGVDSSTQSTKVIAVELEIGAVLAEGRAPHTGLETQDPEDWWVALVKATRQVVSEGFSVRAISVAGQQHGLVTIDANGYPVIPAPLWNNTAAADDAEWLNAMADFASEVGTRLVASITIAKIVHLARTNPDALSRTDKVALPHDWLNFRLTGSLTTDRGDASGSGWWSPATGEVRRDLLALAVGEAEAGRLQVPTVLGPDEPAGFLTEVAAAELGVNAGIPVGPGTGDNMGAALGVAAMPGTYVISLGTSGVAYAVSDSPTFDHTGEVAGFADATGRFLPLACMLNCTRVVDTVADLFDRDTVTVLDLAGEEEPGAAGLLMTPYLAGERTPNLPRASARLSGMTMSNLRPSLLARAAVDSVAAGLSYCVEALRRVSVDNPGVFLVGGGSAHPTWRQAIADAAGLPVSVLAGGEHVARGAAIQAAAIVREEPVEAVSRAWKPDVMALCEPRPEVRAAFRLGERRRLIDEIRSLA